MSTYEFTPLQAAIAAAAAVPGIEVLGVEIEEAGAATTVVGKAPGLKVNRSVTVRFAGGESRRFLIKRLPEDGDRVKECEGLIALHRLGRFDSSATLISHFERASPVGFGIGGPSDMLLLEPLKDIPLLAAVLDDDSRTAGALREDGLALARFLCDRHRPVGTKLDQYARELVGGTFGLMATLDAYPEGELAEDAKRRVLAATMNWVPRIHRGNPVSIHGDFHPWNVFLCPVSRRVETTGGLHTSFGVREDDIACMALNLFLADRGTPALEGFLLGIGAHQPLAPFFLGWRLLVLANPVHFPLRSTHERHQLQRAAVWAMTSSKAPADIAALLQRALRHGDPWANLNVSLRSPLPSRAEPHRVRRPVAVLPIDVVGRILAVRDQGRIRFIDINTPAGVAQIAFERKTEGEWPTIERLRKHDLVSVRGDQVQTRSGSLCVFVSEMVWHRPCLVNPEQADAVLRGAEILGVQSRCLTEARRYLNERTFQEISSPVLRPGFEGGRATPFSTWVRSKGRDGYLRVTSELALKGALVRGSERVYEVGPMFRNEGEDARHLPEFLMLEAYAAGWTLNEMVELACGLLGVMIGDTRPPQRHTAASIIRDHLGVNVDSEAEIDRFCSENGIFRRQGRDGQVGAIYAMLRRFAASRAGGLLVVDKIPAGRAPLTLSTGGYDQRAWIFVNGVSVADVAMEDNDFASVSENLDLQFRSDPRYIPRDYTGFLTDMAIGMPPAAGLGMSLSRVLQVASGLEDIREITPPEWR